ncbi:arf-GAP domain and FG repeat-containing protein 1a isoform X12 [Latimeria chalumnae]|uniref:arf-GAP domain and FG repeat-containing protein 1a isoform X12 n=1 Tax=Latimeria chalumnae TaxID=7897 RepID=UPI0006D8EA23|nr:PREDICTED: arf-GAP domain and FG repeat-containing protein 1 isoform X11 [Latimeria chalumnae]|eukprot:XP_014342159.1 PREDICTED: arf-GAP domain and FG repeat-containing protein 1 isoform X11 [Latimeria chalumnae]
MAASAKRKQEEKHLKMLREMTSLPPNRKCFDCDQRGPTYVNMTVGSFVCTSCSGILRGLNPPHRVKSISMTTFTQQEIEFLQKHGNEICKQIWLGLYDERSSAIPDFRDPQKVKEFLQEKYEKKRWQVNGSSTFHSPLRYVPPEQAKVVASVHASISGSSASSTSSTPEVKPLKTMGETAPTLHLNKSTPSQSPVVGRSQGQQPEKKQFDLLSDLGGDIFAAPAPQANASANFANFAHFNSHTAQNSANADFANFDAFGNSSASDNFGGFPTASQPPFQSQSTGPSGQVGTYSSTAAGPTVPAPNQPMSLADKYAALAELDSVFSSTAPSTNVFSSASSVSSSMFGSVPGGAGAQTQCVASSTMTAYGAATSTNPFVAAPVAPTAAATNPFQPNGRAAAGLLGVMQGQAFPHTHFAASFGTASLSMPAGFGTHTAYNLPTSFSGTFQQPAFPAQTVFPQQQVFPQQPNGAGFPAFGQVKPVVTPFGQTMAAPAVSSNPFMASAPAGQYPAGSSSTNPFL